MAMELPRQLCPCKGCACTQELFHDALPVAVGTGAGPVETFENLMVDAYRQDAEIFPAFFSFSRGEGLQRPVGVREPFWKGLREVCLQFLTRAAQASFFRYRCRMSDRQLLLLLRLR